MGGERDEELGHDRRDSEKERGKRKQAYGRGEGDQEKGPYGTCEYRDDQGAALPYVSQGDQKEETQCIARLYEHCGDADAGLGYMKEPGDFFEQRLGVIQIGDGDSARNRHEEHE